jgi:predicted transcriptional regulator YheO
MPKTRKPKISQEQYFEFLRPIASGIAKTLGDNLCEIVIHDLAHPDSSIVCIEGNVTGRRVGGSLTDLGLANLKLGDEQEDILNYLTQTQNGKVLKSSSIMLRDEKGHVFGTLCINIDMSKFIALENLIRELVDFDLQIHIRETFSDDINEVLQTLIGDANNKIGRPVEEMSKQDKVRFVAFLDEKGAFNVKKAVPFVAEYLDVSRFTIYNYLKEARGD